MHQIQRYILRAGFPEHEPSFDMVVSMQGLNGLIGKFSEIGKLSTLHYRDDQSLTSQVVGTGAFNQTYAPEEILTKIDRIFIESVLYIVELIISFVAFSLLVSGPGGHTWPHVPSELLIHGSIQTELLAVILTH